LRNEAFEELISLSGMQAARGWKMGSGELTEPAREGTKRATDERNRGKVRQRSHEVPLGEERKAFSEKKTCPTGQDALAGGEAMERAQGFWDAEELDPDRALG
jgi:hypothetical protein